jgi:hypothetical protein
MGRLNEAFSSPGQTVCVVLPLCAQTVPEWGENNR